MKTVGERYWELCKWFPLVPIDNDEELDAAHAVAVGAVQ
jgi:hypothetical protein